MRVLWWNVLAVTTLVVTVSALNNGLGLTPQMGWNSWNHFGCNVDEQLIRQTADAIVSTGLKDAGYVYVNIDDCWQVSRDASGRIQEDPQRFPSGMKALADYVHSRGLKFGLYSDAGNKTCQGRPGSLGYEQIDAQTYAEWGVDYLKYDNCYNDNIPPETRYPPMRDALNATGHKIFFSMCEWGQDNPATWAPAVGNSWRTTGDIGDRWSSMYGNIVSQDRWWQYAGPGGWNDPDMLEIGNGGMSTTEYWTHFSLWCLAKAPLIIGCDVTAMSNDTLRILTNREAIAVNQDPLGVQGHRISAVGFAEVWAGPLSGNRVAAVLLNTWAFTQTVSVEFKDLGLSPTASYVVRDLWEQADVGTFQGSYKVSLPSHGSAFIVIRSA